MAASLVNILGQIATAQNAQVKAGLIAAYVNLVTAQTGISITSDNAATLIGLVGLL